MGTMTDSETYNGYANRETWAFNLHWQNDQGLYNATLEEAQRWLDEESTEGIPVHNASALGEHVVNYWREYIADFTDMTGTPLPDALAMFRDEVGSWWRIDYAEVGAAVRESLDVES